MLTSEQIDILTELVNVGVGKAAYSLSEMVRCRVGLKVPEVEVGRWSEIGASTRFRPSTDDGLSLVTQSFNGPLAGIAALVFPRGSARSLVSLLTDAASDSAEIDAEREAVLTEIGNIIINGVMGSLGNLTTQCVEFGLPTYREGDLAPMLGLRSGERSVVVVDVLFSIQQHSVEGQLAVIFELSSLSGVWRLLKPESTSLLVSAG